MFDYALVKDELRRGIFDIEFVKANGKTRRLKGTMYPPLVPPFNEPRDEISEAAAKSLRKRSATREGRKLVTVWSLDDEGFRTFEVSKLKTFEPIEYQEDLFDETDNRG